MGREYKIKFAVPGNYDATALQQKLPSPIHSAAQGDSYQYAIEPDGFYFVDHLVDRTVAAVALRCLIDEALGLTDTVELTEP
ncbi:hypothetical protein [Comamonas sp. 17RB]|uniref:hypothetical protein n=1 Tax=Comamonas sp. 17RB TaxID=3047025 RepID=UPI0024B77A6C|nr:hypothetical protein [Comamonas sp. 17RB]MDI9853895.1 hypothetical protein [Comamonas sp. 17RB]